MGFLSVIKQIYKNINEVESNILGKNQDYEEIRKINIRLEAEVTQRTKDLELANKRVLTLQHIFNLINSDESLQSVLDTSLKGELGYIWSKIIQNCDEDEFLSDVLKSREARTTTDTGKILSKLKVKKSVQNISRSLMAIPLFTQHKPFGVFVIVSPRARITTAEQDFLKLFASQVEMAITIADLFDMVKKQALTDSLTGLYNRRYFEEQTAKEVVRATRQKQPLSVIGLDLDFLKKINAPLGHTYGDIAIKTVAQVLHNNARSIDIPARLGGEEFNVLLPGVDSRGAMVAAERLRKAIEDQKLDKIGTITASIGVATFLEHSDDIDEIMELTDQAMYKSKRDGRNRVTMAKAASETSWQEIAFNTFTDILSKHNIPLPKDITANLQEKLKQTGQDVLYSVSDILATTYNPSQSQGVAKAKSNMAVSLAKRFDLPKEDVDNLRVAMLLYDIGKLMVPPKILQKAGSLTEDEKKTVQEHPIFAAKKILKPISYIQDVIPIIEDHHENWDGSGYPNKKSKDEIPLASQIVLIVDAYFALIQERPHRPKMSTKQALDVIRQNSDKKWNSTIVDEFVSLVKNTQ